MTVRRCLHSVDREFLELVHCFAGYRILGSERRPFSCEWRQSHSYVELEFSSLLLFKQAAMYHPIQRLACSNDFILAACGPKVFSLSSSNGSILSTWPSLLKSEESQEEPPEKRRKVVANGNGLPPSIINLRASNDGQHIVVVTGEDKCVHVLELDKAGQLVHLSQR